ncbi:MAG: hypothetical protein HZA92_03605 [Verrucomicrobia bacterium]|nr:hypothetical protein [Verrucomicrobiota bacterium]
MSFLRGLALRALALWLALAPASLRAALPAGVSQGEFLGWTNALSLRDDHGKVMTVVVPDIGGRVVQYSRGGVNALLENPDSNGRTLAQFPGGFWVGGYQCDFGPGLLGRPERQAVWLGPHASVAPRDQTAETASPLDAVTGLRLLKSFTLDPDTGALGVVQRMVNTSPNPSRQNLHDRTLCPAGGFVLLPLPRQSHHRAGWALLRATEEGSSFDGEQPASPNARVFGDLLVAQALGAPGKLGSDADAGWVAYVRGRLLFVKYFQTWRGALYAGAGHTVEFSWNDQMAALELFSPLTALQPGKAFDFPELWQLIELKQPVTTFDDASAAAKKVPPSPFAPRP